MTLSNAVSWSYLQHQCYVVMYLILIRVIMCVWLWYMALCQYVLFDWLITRCTRYVVIWRFFYCPTSPNPVIQSSFLLNHYSGNRKGISLKQSMKPLPQCSAWSQSTPVGLLNNKYDCTIDQELAYPAAWACTWSSCLLARWHHFSVGNDVLADRFEIMTISWKSESVSGCVFM